MKKVSESPLGLQPAPNYQNDLAAFLDKDGVANLLSISRRSVDNMLARGELPHVRLSKRCIRFPKDAVLEALNRRVVGKV